MRGLLDSFNAKNTIRARKIPCIIVDVIVTQHHGRPSTQISRKLVVLGYIVAGFGSFWVVLLVVLGGFGWFWVVLGRFGWFWVVPCFSNYDLNLLLESYSPWLPFVGGCRWLLNFSRWL